MMSEGKTISNEDIYKLLQTLNDNNKRIEERLERIESNFYERVKTIQEKIQILEVEKKQLKNHIYDLQKRQKKYNLIIYGIKENETNIKLTEDIKSKLEISIEPSEIKDSYRLGKLTENKKPRPLLIELTSYSKKIDILKNCYKLKGSEIAIANDYTEQELQQRKILLKHLKQARASHYEAKIQKNKLVINGKIYEIEDLQKDDFDMQGLSSEIINTPTSPLTNRKEDISELQENPLSNEESTSRVLRKNLPNTRGVDKQRKLNIEEKEQKDTKKKKKN